MKLDDSFTFIFICPDTKRKISSSRIHSTNVCPRCGHEMKTASYCHHERVVGKWNMPSWFEIVFKGKKAVFIPKEDLL